MTESEIREAYSRLFEKPYDDPTLADDLRPLLEAAQEIHADTWKLVIEARIALEIRAHDAVGGLLVVEPGECFDLRRRKTRPGFRHIETAVAGETRKQCAFEGKGLGFAPGAHIPQS